jgi:uncharacterized membrane protein
MTFSTFDNPIRWLFLAHAIAGALALLVLAIPLISKKGGKLHVKAGWIYICAMVFVGVSAFIITPWRVFFDPAKTVSSENFSIFLFFISIFTLSAISYGLTSLKSKQRKAPSRSVIHLGPPIATMLVGLIVQIIGFKSQNVLLMAFPFLGHTTSKSQLQCWLKTPTEKMHWWYAHMNGMFVACIATITAFLVTAVPRIWPGPISNSPILWIAPGVILGTILNRWTSSFRAKYEKAAS